MCSVDEEVVMDNTTQSDVAITTIINDDGTTQNDKHIVTEDVDITMDHVDGSTHSTTEDNDIDGSTHSTTEDNDITMDHVDRSTHSTTEDNNIDAVNPVAIATTLYDNVQCSFVTNSTSTLSDQYDFNLLFVHICMYTYVHVMYKVINNLCRYVTPSTAS